MDGVSGEKENWLQDRLEGTQTSANFIQICHGEMYETRTSFLIFATTIIHVVFGCHGLDTERARYSGSNPHHSFFLNYSKK